MVKKNTCRHRSSVTGNHQTHSTALQSQHDQTVQLKCTEEYSNQNGLIQWWSILLSSQINHDDWLDDAAIHAVFNHRTGLAWSMSKHVMDRLASDHTLQLEQWHHYCSTWWLLNAIVSNWIQNWNNQNWGSARTRSLPWIQIHGRSFPRNMWLQCTTCNQLCLSSSVSRPGGQQKNIKISPDDSLGVSLHRSKNPFDEREGKHFAWHLPARGQRGECALSWWRIEQTE